MISRARLYSSSVSSERTYEELKLPKKIKAAGGGICRSERTYEELKPAIRRRTMPDHSIGSERTYEELKPQRVG